MEARLMNLGCIACLHALWVGGLIKGTVASASAPVWEKADPEPHSDARQFSVSHMSLVLFKLCPCAGAQME